MSKATAKHADAELLARIDADTDEPTGPAIDAAPLRDLARAVAVRDDAERAIGAAVDAARDQGLSWATIGAVLGISRQGALQRYGS